MADESAKSKGWRETAYRLREEATKMADIDTLIGQISERLDIRKRNGDASTLEELTEQLIARLRAGGEPGWRTMESAPKDRSIDFWNAVIGHRLTDIRWDEERQQFGVWATPDNDDDEPYFVAVEMLGITHWRDKPSPPSPSPPDTRYTNEFGFPDVAPPSSPSPPEREPGTGWTLSEETKRDLRAIDENAALARHSDFLVGSPPERGVRLDAAVKAVDGMIFVPGRTPPEFSRRVALAALKAAWPEVWP